MLQTIITCDVCGIDERGPYPKETPGKYWKGEVAGGRWYKLAIFNDSATEGAAISEVTIDVCPECAEKLADQLGMDELPPLVEEEEEDGKGTLITTYPTWPTTYPDKGTADIQWTYTTDRTYTTDITGA